ncbi:hypothetical protein P3T24_007758, partial [Paraburkholderia sp. GAS33]|uniref:hypothetical protein n=1 Tax=Paraburkholderia sp. GAS33 TaxID=3035130 RepID=UPI003D19C334
TRLLRFATVIVAPVTGSLLPNDRLHKTIYTLAPQDRGHIEVRAAIVSGDLGATIEHRSLVAPNLSCLLF